MVELLVGGFVAGCLLEALSDKKQTKTRYKKQIAFFDAYRELDVNLARNVGQGSGGVSLLIKGLEISRSNAAACCALKNMRNYRNILSHVREKWKNIEAPGDQLLAEMREVTKWINRNYRDVQLLVYQGQKAYNKKNQKQNRSYSGYKTGKCGKKHW